MVKIFIDTGIGKIEEREKTDFSKKETIGDVINDFSLDLNAVEVLECKYCGNDIPLDFELKPGHSEIRVRLKSYQITLRYKYKDSGISWQGIVQCTANEYMTQILYRQIKENGHPHANIKSFDHLVGCNNVYAENGGVYSVVLVKRSMVTFEFTHNEKKQVVQQYADDDDRVYRLAYQMLQERLISTLEFDVHIFIADSEKADEKLKKIPPFSKVSFGQTYKIFLLPAYYPTSLSEDNKNLVESLQNGLAEIEANSKKLNQLFRPRVPPRTTNNADEGLKKSSTELSEDSRKEEERIVALLRATTKRIRHSMDKRLEVEKSYTAPISPAAVDSKTPKTGSEVTKTSRKEFSNIVYKILAEFMKELTVQMTDDTLRQMEAIKSMIEEKNKATHDCTKLLLKELEIFAEVWKEHINKFYNEMNTKLEHERKLAAELRQDLKLSKSQCELNLRKMEGYKKRMDEEIERNVELNWRLQDMAEQLNRLTIHSNTISNGKESEKLEESSTCESFEVLNQDQFQISDDSPHG